MKEFEPPDWIHVYSTSPVSPSFAYRLFGMRYWNGGMSNFSPAIPMVRFGRIATEMLDGRY